MAQVRDAKPSVKGPNRLGFRKMLYADQRLVETDLRTAVGISDLFNTDRGYAWASLDYLSRSTGCHVRSIKRSVRKLHQLGIIKNIGGGRGRTNEYQPAFPPRAYDLPLAEGGLAWGPYTSWYGAASLVEQSGAQVSLGRRSGVPIEGAQVSPQTTTNLRSETKQVSRDDGAITGAAPVGSRRAVAAEDGDILGFDELFAAYPKPQHEGYVEADERERAKVPYAEALASGVSPGELLAKASQAAVATAHLVGEKRQYIQWPAKWLKTKGWLKDPQPPRAKVGGSKVDCGARKKASKKASKPASKSAAPKKKAKAESAPLYDAEAELEAIKARDRKERLPSLGLLRLTWGKEAELLIPKNWRGYCFVRYPDADFIQSIHVGQVCDIANNVRCEHDGEMTPEAAEAERMTLGMLNGWTYEELYTKHSEARRALAPPAAVVPVAALATTVPESVTPEPVVAQATRAARVPLTPERIAELRASNDFG